MHSGLTSVKLRLWHKRIEHLAHNAGQEKNKQRNNQTKPNNFAPAEAKNHILSHDKQNLIWNISLYKTT